MILLFFIRKFIELQEPHKSIEPLDGSITKEPSTFPDVRRLKHLRRRSLAMLNLSLGKHIIVKWVKSAKCAPVDVC